MAEQNPGEAQFGIQKIYCKDLSVETPNSPDIFTQEWKPETKLNLGTEHKVIGDNVYEVVIRITVTTTCGEKTAYLVEVHQAGVFNIAGVPEPQLGGMLGADRPNILFAYARECVADMIGKAGFPQLHLAPVNFDAVYAQHLQQQQNAAAAPAGKQVEH